MIGDGCNSRPQFERMWRNETTDSPYWLRQAVEQKSPRLIVDLADSVPLTYDDLDIKLSISARMN